MTARLRARSETVSAGPGITRTLPNPDPMAFDLPPLPYDYDALEPHIDEQTMRIHHDKHHAGYTTKLNAALEGTEWADQPIDRTLADLDALTGLHNHRYFHETLEREAARAQRYGRDLALILFDIDDFNDDICYFD